MDVEGTWKSMNNPPYALFSWSRMGAGLASERARVCWRVPATRNIRVLSASGRVCGQKGTDWALATLIHWPEAPGFTTSCTSTSKLAKLDRMKKGVKMTCQIITDLFLAPRFQTVFGMTKRIPQDRRQLLVGTDLFGESFVAELDVNAQLVASIIRTA